MKQAGLIATLREPAALLDQEISSVSNLVAGIEVRADLIPDFNPASFRSRLQTKLIYSLRSQATGGEFRNNPGVRSRLLKAAVENYDLIELEADLDLTPEILSSVPPVKRLISWRGSVNCVDELVNHFHRLNPVRCALFRFETTASNSVEAILPLVFLQKTARKDILAYATGKAGYWSRVIAPHLGAATVFGELDPHAEGEAPAISRLIQDYGFPQLSPVSKVFGIVGKNLESSLSPRLHNHSYRALDVPGIYLPFYVDSFSGFWSRFVASNILQEIGFQLGGLTVTSPYKEAALQVASPGSPLTAKAHSGNTVYPKDGRWLTETADEYGVLAPLRARQIGITGKTAAVIGCGGSGRAIAATLDQAGASVTLVNRGRERGLMAQRLLGLPFIPLAEFSPPGFSIIVNATPVGRDGIQTPFELAGLDQDATVIDLVYGQRPTPLACGLNESGHTVIDGWEILLSQAARQFWLMTGVEMPIDTARRAIGREIGGNFHQGEQQNSLPTFDRDRRSPRRLQLNLH